MKITKIKVWYHIEDGGDGSANVSFYPDRRSAQAAADTEFELFGQALDDNVKSIVLNIEDFEVVG